MIMYLNFFNKKIKFNPNIIIYLINTKKIFSEYIYDIKKFAIIKLININRPINN